MLRYGRAVAAGVCFTLALILPSATGIAQQRGPNATAVIVVFKSDTPFELFRPNYRADERAAANPAAWNYQDRGVVGLVQAMEARDGFRARRVYSKALRGFAARLTAEQIAALQADVNVAYIETDGVMEIVAQTLPWGINKIDADVSTTVAGNGAGSVNGVSVYVIDTGIAGTTTHRDLNVAGHVNLTDDNKNYDCNGHGTHVAGTAAAKDDTNDVVGVAPGAPVIGVKVLGCDGSGTYSDVIQGIDWVTGNASGAAVANMSLGGGASQAVDDAVRTSAASGVFYALAAGNNGANACYSSPARAGAGTNNGIMTVAAVDSRDREASWSNYGPCVDIWAPGVSILSTRLGGGTTSMSGTSMASPHVAGAGALYVSGHAGNTSAQIEAAIKNAVVTPGAKGKGGYRIKRLDVGDF